MLDLDGFKEVNDTWGHAAGDKVLAMVGERARRSVRAADTVGRLGGDEFLAILPEATHEGALQVAEKLRAALSEPYPLGDATRRRSGASVGVSYFGEHGTDAEALLRRADEALYEAKRRGQGPRAGSRAADLAQARRCSPRAPACRPRTASRRWDPSPHAGARPTHRP